jgi:hypothetical protein
MAAFQFYLQSEEQTKLEWVWGNSHVYFGKMFPGGKGSAVGALS